MSGISEGVWSLNKYCASLTRWRSGRNQSQIKRISKISTAIADSSSKDSHELSNLKAATGHFRPCTSDGDVCSQEVIPVLASDPVACDPVCPGLSSCSPTSHRIYQSEHIG
mgnify:CR=1 FL=1